ncbi:hypothetical protein [Lysobacter gummosus]
MAFAICSSLNTPHRPSRLTCMSRPTDCISPIVSRVRASATA